MAGSHAFSLSIYGLLITHLWCLSCLIEDAPLSEKLHVLALDAMVSGRYREATVIYETILLHDHRDLLALRCSFDLYLLLGYVVRTCSIQPLSSHQELLGIGTKW